MFIDAGVLTFGVIVCCCCCCCCCFCTGPSSSLLLLLVFLLVLIFWVQGRRWNGRKVGRYNLRVFNPAGSFVSVCYSRNVGPCFLEILTNQAYEWREITAITAVVIPALMLPGGIFHLWGSSVEGRALIRKTCLVQQQLCEIKAKREVLLFCCCCCCIEIFVE